MEVVATVVEVTRRLDMAWRWRMVRLFSSCCVFMATAPGGLRAVGNRILTGLANVMLGTEVICVDRFSIDAVAAACEISG